MSDKTIITIEVTRVPRGFVVETQDEFVLDAKGMAAVAMFVLDLLALGTEGKPEVRSIHIAARAARAAFPRVKTQTGPELLQ